MPREARDPDVFTEATPANLKELAWAYQPIMRFADSESFFPVLAESWLTHTTSAAWRQEDAESEDLPVDAGRHGTAIATADAGVTAIEQLGGAPNASDRPIQLSSGNDPDAIGNYSNADPDVFLDFGGWLPGEGVRKGNRDYDYAAFSELAAAINPRREWTLIEGESHLPHMWVPQPPTPTAYVEAEWAGKFPDWAEEFERPDFPSGDTRLDDYLALTYHYLYAIREPAPEADGPRRLEGQWEAVTLFFRGRREGGDREEDRRPNRFLFQEPPRWAAYSQGLAPEQTVIHRAQVRPWETQRIVTSDQAPGDPPLTIPGVEKVGINPVVYVGSGTHRNLFGPAGDVPWTPDGRGSSGIGYDPGGELPGVEMLIAWALAAAALGLFVLSAALALAAWVLAAAVLLAVLAVLLIIAAILLLVLYVISIFTERSDQASGDPLPEWQDVDETGDRGSPQGVATNERPPGGSGSESPAGSPGSPGAAAMAPGVTNTGSPKGFNTVEFDLRLIDMWDSDRRTSYPAGEATEYPHWWDYTGRWGVRVEPRVDNDWQDGTRRVDRFRRSWSYWNAYWLLDFWAQPDYPGP